MNQHATLPRNAQDFPETSLGGYLPVARNRRPAEETKLVGSTALAAFTSALDRVEEAVEQETAALEARSSADLEDFNLRKSRSLLELTRLTRTLPAQLDDRLRERLAKLREKLRRNQAVLALHLTAVREIADLLVTAIGQADSDGTYAMSGHREGT